MFPSGLPVRKYPFLQLIEETTIYVHASDSFSQSDPRKNEREYECYKKIFDRKELKKILPVTSKNRLLSKCHLLSSHLKPISNNKNIRHCDTHLFHFVFTPKSYNGTTNKVLFVTFIYNLPLFGSLIKKNDSTSKKKCLPIKNLISQL